MLTLAAGQVECLRDAVLPAECANLPEDLARPDRVLADETSLCRSRWGQAARHPQFLRRGLCQLGATSFRWWELVAGHTLRSQRPLLGALELLVAENPAIPQDLELGDVVVW